MLFGRIWERNGSVAEVRDKRGAAWFQRVKVEAPVGPAVVERNFSNDNLAGERCLQGQGATGSEQPAVIFEYAIDRQAHLGTDLARDDFDHRGINHGRGLVNLLGRAARLTKALPMRGGRGVELNQHERKGT
ncbi:MAG: hypothetical protein ACKVVP_07350 [Chloroflexota bacterium]